MRCNYHEILDTTFRRRFFFLCRRQKHYNNVHKIGRNFPLPSFHIHLQLMRKVYDYLLLKIKLNDIITAYTKALKTLKTLTKHNVLNEKVAKNMNEENG